ncbi:Aldo/keto reductase [Exidia glandulosa HHB12029]|uniref:Aldo/keto reductase n=1 Tax=Exidia glandulosa HHB12029 TaxID=1314781 RepID=A0A165E4Z7_EXIGL|nr:Aldo/keto reductase [Exidia glandulosa HHB12029]
MVALKIPTFTLNTGAKIPAIGLGAWMGTYGAQERAEAMVAKALKLGYRAIDTAAGYGSEAAVGRAIRGSGIPRGEIFVTTKLLSKHHSNVQEAFDKSLKELDVEYIDLYLMHWPQAEVNANSEMLEDALRHRGTSKAV